MAGWTSARDAFRSWSFTARGRAARYAERNAPVHGARPDEWTPERRESWLRASYGDAWYERHTSPRGTDRWRDTAIRDIGRSAVAAWTRIDPDGWFRPSYAWWLTWEVAAGRNTLAGAWACWCNNPGQDRYSRRRADAVRRVRRLDWREAAVAIAGGRLAVRASRRSLRSRRAGLRERGLLYRWTAAVVVDGESTAHRRARGDARGAPAAHPHPGWAVRRWRVASWVARGVANGSLRPAAVPDAWVVACAASDGIDVHSGTHRRNDRSVPDAADDRTNNRR